MIRRVATTDAPWDASDHSAREHRLLVLATRQHGVVSLVDLSALGFSASGVRSRVARGRLHRLYPGVYAVGRPDLTREGHWLAAVKAAGEGAVLSHRSAAALHGLRPSSAASIELTVRRAFRPQLRGLRVHRSTSVAGKDVTTVDAIPCTTPNRTLFDLAAVVGPDALERACERAEELGLLDMAALSHLLNRPARGVRNLRAALARLGDGATRSELEVRFRTLCRQAGLPPPEVNGWLSLGGGHVLIDFLWRRQRVAVETDGYHYHRDRRSFARDRRRDQLLGLEGWQHARFTWEQVLNEPEHVIRVVRALIAAGAPRAQ